MSFFIPGLYSSTCQVHSVFFAGLNNKRMQSSSETDNVQCILVSLFKTLWVIISNADFVFLAFNHDRRNCFP